MPHGTQQPEVGLVVAGKYSLTRLLGRGGMGSVWEGVHQSLGTRVAVKFIESEFAKQPELRDRFVNEARAAARLQSKHIVQIYDHGVSDDGCPYIVMEYLSGEPLDARLARDGALPVQDVAPLIHQLSRGLKRAHDAGIVHRDLKPENVFLVWDEEDQRDIVKVVDFGIAKFTGDGGISSTTRTGAVMGTPHYMSPEQARGLKGVDQRSDVWSVGVIAYRAVTGVLPFDGEAMGDLLVKICTQPPLAPSESVPVPPGFDAWMARSLAKEPSTRFSSVEDQAETLAGLSGLAVTGTGARPALAASVSTAGFDTAPGIAAGLPRSRSGSIYGVIALAVAALVAAALWFWRSGDVSPEPVAASVSEPDRVQELQAEPSPAPPVEEEAAPPKPEPSSAERPAALKSPAPSAAGNPKRAPKKRPRPRTTPSNPKPPARPAPEDELGY